MATKAVPEHLRWVGETMGVGPDDHLLEIGCGPGVAVALICERLVSGRIVAHRPIGHGDQSCDPAQC